MNNNRKPPERPEDPTTPVTVKFTGNITEIRYCGRTTSNPIRKIDQDHGLDIRTGEILEFHHTQNRSENKAGVAQSLKRLRDIINTNLTNPHTALWVTLTYRENMTDPKRLYEDYRRFWLRFRYYLEKRNLPPAEYIAAAEPQGRGAWHLHCLFFFPQRAPFVPNEDMARLWRNGFTKTKSLKGIDNPGLYLTAYLGDMELEEAINAGCSIGTIVEVESRDTSQSHRKKAIAKGARLCLYPSGFNLYRCSQGIRRPVILQTTESEAQKLVGSAPLVFEKTAVLTDAEGNLLNFFHYRQYNRAKKPDDTPDQTEMPTC